MIAVNYEFLQSPKAPAQKHKLILTWVIYSDLRSNADVVTHIVNALDAIKESPLAHCLSACHARAYPVQCCSVTF